MFESRGGYFFVLYYVHGCIGCEVLEGLEGLNREDFFEMEVDKRTRGHTLTILKRGARLDCRKYSFSQRVVNIWNALPAEAVSCTTVNSFKGKLHH